MPDLSVVVPVFDEALNIAKLVDEIAAALDGVARYEIVIVDDGSVDETAAVVGLCQARLPGRLRLVRHAARCGQSAALRSGVTAARADLVATLDGDGQNDPADIPVLLSAMRRERAATPGMPVLIAGFRRKRRDRWRKRIASQLANHIRMALLHDATPDTGCGLKLFLRRDFLEFPYFDHMHRYLGALMLRQKGRVVSVAVSHRPRLLGVSKYGVFDRLLVGIVDILGVMWLQRRGRVPRLLPGATPDMSHERSGVTAHDQEKDG